MPSPPTNRAIQLDGLRAIAMLGICYDHWVPKSWNFGLPYEIGLYFFLVLTGYFITGSLLRTRDRAESAADGDAWRWKAFKKFQYRRGLRIIAPYYFAVALAFIFLAPKLLAHIHYYLLYLTNFHIALAGEWPPGTSHFWSIAIQQQFYLTWPLLIWLCPKKYLPLAILVFTALAPASRYLSEYFTPPFVWPDKISWGVFDFFGIGGMMALATHRGLPLSSRVWKILGVVGCSIYLILQFGPHLGLPHNQIGPFYATILSIGFCGVIATASLGWNNLLGRILESKFLQRVGLLSYGIYLFHNLAPIILGKTLPFLWWGPYADSPAQILLRTTCFALLTWALTLFSWKYIETPLSRLRSR